MKSDKEKLQKQVTNKGLRFTQTPLILTVVSKIVDSTCQFLHIVNHMSTITKNWTFFGANSMKKVYLSRKKGPSWLRM